MGLSAVGDAVLVIGLVTAVLVISTLALATTLVARGVRRRYRAVRGRIGLVDVRSGAPRNLPAAGAVVAATLGSPAWWAVQRDRRRMWRVVSSAEHAVAVAQQAGAPVGDLPALARRLTTAARGVDALLRASARARSGRGDARVERRRVEAAAADLHRAALDSLRAVSAADTEPVLSAVRLEVAALGAGVRAVTQASERPAL